MPNFISKVFLDYTPTTGDTSDSILMYDSTGEIKVVSGNTYLTTETDSQTLTWTSSTNNLAISGGNSVTIDQMDILGINGAVATTTTPFAVDTIHGDFIKLGAIKLENRTSNSTQIIYGTAGNSIRLYPSDATSEGGFTINSKTSPSSPGSATINTGVPTSGSNPAGRINIYAGFANSSPTSFANAEGGKVELRGGQAQGGATYNAPGGSITLRGGSGSGSGGIGDIILGPFGGNVLVGGSTPTSSGLFNVGESTDGDVVSYLVNSNAGTSARALFRIQNSTASGAQLTFGVTGSGYTGTGGATRAFIEAASATTGLDIKVVADPIRFTYANVAKLTIDNTLSTFSTVVAGVDPTADTHLVTRGWANTEYQDSNANLTSLAGLTYASDAFVKMTGANTFTLDTTTYSDDIHANIAALDLVSGTNTGDQTITLTGDVTGSGTGSFATTLATVNSNVGTFTHATVTVNAKGLITAVSSGTDDNENFYLDGVTVNSISDVDFTMTGIADITGVDFTHNLTSHSDVVSATNTNRFVLAANGTTGYVGRLLVEADISDLGTYSTDIHSNISALNSVTSASGANTGDNAVNTLYSGLVSNATHTGDVTGATALTIGADKVLDSHINWGTGATQVSTTDMPEGTNLYYTDTRAEDAAGALMTDTAEINFTYTANTSITANIITGSIDVLKLDSGVQASLGLADTSVQTVTASGSLSHSGTTAKTISHLTTAGHKHIPTGGATDQWLKYSASGTAVWDTLPAGGTVLGTIADTQIQVGTSTANTIGGSTNLTWNGTVLDVNGYVDVINDIRFGNPSAAATTHTISVEGNSGGGTLTLTPYGTGHTQVNSSLLVEGLGAFTVSDSATSTSSIVGSFLHNTSGTPANGLGTMVQFKAETSTTLDVLMGDIDFSWTDVTHATRTSQIELNGVVSGSLTNYATFASDGITLNNGQVNVTSTDLAVLGIQAATSKAGSLDYFTGGTATADRRWRVSKSQTAETGSNLGSNFQINRYSDTGASLGSALIINRSTGSIDLDGTLKMNQHSITGVDEISTTSNVTVGGDLSSDRFLLAEIVTTADATDYWIKTSGSNIVRPKSLANVKTEIVTSAAVIAGLGYTPGTSSSPMVYPGAGIAVSTGSAWGTSITNNSANWNTAFGWGNHAGLYNSQATGTSTNMSAATAKYMNSFTITNGVLQSYTTSTMTLANLGYTGATNANYITNNNQLSNGAGYVTASHNHSASQITSGVLNVARLSGNGSLSATPQYPAVQFNRFGSNQNFDATINWISGFYGGYSTMTNGPTGMNYDPFIAARSGGDVSAVLVIPRTANRALAWKGYSSSGASRTTWQYALHSTTSQSFGYTNTSNSPTYVWATNSSGTSFLAARASMSVNYATSAGSATTATTATNANNVNIGSSPAATVMYPVLADGTGNRDLDYDVKFRWDSNSDRIITYNSQTGNGQSYDQFRFYNDVSSRYAAIGTYRGSINYTGIVFWTANNATPTVRMRLSSAGQLDVDGNVVAYSSAVSDIRVKENINKLDSKQALKTILSLDAIDYTHKFKNKDKLHSGYIAQDFEKELPHLIDELSVLGQEDWGFEVEDKIKTINYTEVIPYITEAMKEQQREIEELKELVKQLINDKKNG